jgi:acyl dehydratase
LADKGKLGTRYEFNWVVERGKIAEFIEAVGDHDPVCRDPEAARRSSFRDVVAPPTFTTVPVMWSGALFQAFDDLGIPLSRIMHAEQSYEFFREIYPGDVLRGIMEIKSITEREGRSGLMQFVLLETTFTNQHQEEVVREEILIVETKRS